MALAPGLNQGSLDYQVLGESNLMQNCGNLEGILILHCCPIMTAG